MSPPLPSPGEASSEQASLGLTFQFLQESSQSIQVLQSSLWVYARSSGRDSRLSAQVFLSAAGEGGGAEPLSNRTLLIKKTLEVRDSNWHTFPIGRTLQALLDGGRSQLRLEVTCEHDGGGNLCLLDAAAADSPHRPFVVAKVRLREQGGRHALRKRSLRCGEDVSVCCKRDFYVKFKDIQWSDWIIAPEGYHMNYCTGQCPQHLSGTPGISSSFHASVFSQLKVSGAPTPMSSCCIPTERQALSIVYFNSQHSIVKTDIPDMIVESCGCT